VKSWFAVDVVVDAPAREAIEYGLMEAGALGTETDVQSETFSVTGYFEAQPDIATVREALIDALRIYGQNSSSIVGLNSREFADRDWLAEWKKSWQPVQVGRFIIAPPWLSVPPAVAGGSNTQRHIHDALHDPVAIAPGSDTIIIRINPGMAFGTGTHETTRLCLKAIDKYFRGGSFLDVGTGTGVLAIAAAKMFSDARIGACDTDADAIAIAKENAELNDVAAEIDFRVGTVNEQTQSADFVCANLTAPVIIELLPTLLGATCGRLLLSGILDTQVEMVKFRLHELGVADFEIDQDGEWIALVI
jgi:ribosomal protein L11 methyltransferase